MSYKSCKEIKAVLEKSRLREKHSNEEGKEKIEDEGENSGHLPIIADEVDCDH